MTPVCKFDERIHCKEDQSTCMDKCKFAVSVTGGRERLEDLPTEVHWAAMREYYRAAKKFGKTNHSPHESYAVILEEYEEAEDEAREFKKTLDDYWLGVKKNSKTDWTLEEMREIAERAAAEWIQVAAMCFKAGVEEATP